MALVHLRDSPAFADVLPSKLFEAMAMGLPVLLVSPEGEASRLVKSQGGGPWVAAGRPKVLAEAVEKLFRDDNTLSSYATASLKAAPLYSRKRQAEEMLRVFEQTATKK